MRFLIVKQVNLKDMNVYEGMERPRLGGFMDVAQPLINRYYELDAFPAEQVETPYKELLHNIWAGGNISYELLALDHKGASSQEWEFLGYDVGETLEATWSAIKHRQDWLTLEQQTVWNEHLGIQGLFQVRSDAEEFLKVYLASDDPDKGWTPEGWTDNPDWYSVFTIHRLLIARKS